MNPMEMFYLDCAQQVAGMLGRVIYSYVLHYVTHAVNIVHMYNI